MKLNKDILLIWIMATCIGAILLYFVKSNSDNQLLLAQLEQHKKQLIQHEIDCNDLQACLDTTLSYSEQLDSCYTIDPLWGWPGDKSEELLTTCKLFKRIRRANGQ